MNYFVRLVGGEFEVVEKSTGQVIKSFGRHIDARRMSMDLNAGQGFDGWTPAFIFSERETRPLPR